MSRLTLIDRVSTSDPKSALALQRSIQVVVWFHGENSATPSGTALMMLDVDKMVAAKGSRDPTLASVDFSMMDYLSGIVRKSQSEGLPKYQEPTQPKEPVKPKHKAKPNRARFKSKAHKKKFPGNKVGTNRVEDASSMGVDIDNQVGIMH
ncbi:hypothetical protein PVL29_022844 [Vitis rotundifolia]|uniref:Uncharacterized protein n=1 Tax=Vitis rotundifolia TaxID=103349 RepID=A0AA38YWP2_VITRO|nr:hypothetical protein PVL29_022844 [Vitis rotundifolia]